MNVTCEYLPNISDCRSCLSQPNRLWCIPSTGGCFVGDADGCGGKCEGYVEDSAQCSNKIPIFSNTLIIVIVAFGTIAVFILCVLSSYTYVRKCARTSPTNNPKKVYVEAKASPIVAVAIAKPYEDDIETSEVKSNDDPTIRH